MPLNDMLIRKAKPLPKQYRLADSGGLYLQVSPSGAKLWRYKYRIGGRENVYSIGIYPDVSLLDARRIHAEARQRVAAGQHPLKHQRDQAAMVARRSAMTFGVVYAEWLAMKDAAGRWTDYYRKQVARGFEADLLPALGDRPIAEITAQELKAVLDGVVARGAPAVAINLRQWSSAVFTHAMIDGRVAANPATALHRTIARPPTQHAKALGEDGAGVLLARINAYRGYLTTQCGLKLLAYTFVRTVEMRRAEWSEFDLDARVWSIPASKMKKRRVHLVPLADQVVAVLALLRPLTGGGRYLFPNSRRPDAIMSATTINRALEHMGYGSAEVTGHDFRATASTMLYEAGYREELVETQLAHVEEKRTKRAYNHAAYLEERRAMMQWFADQMDAHAATQAAQALPRKAG